MTPLLAVPNLPLLHGIIRTFPLGVPGNCGTATAGTFLIAASCWILLLVTAAEVNLVIIVAWHFIFLTGIGGRRSLL